MASILPWPNRNSQMMIFVINFTEFWKKYIQHIRLLVGHSQRHHFKPMNHIPGLEATSWSLFWVLLFRLKKGGGCTLFHWRIPTYSKFFFWKEVDEDVVLDEEIYWSMNGDSYNIYIYESTVKMVEIRCSVLEYHVSDSDPPPKFTSNWCK